MVNILKPHTQDHNSARTVAFRETADRISELASRNGVMVRGYSQPDLPLYRSLSEQKQIQALASLKLFHNSLDTENSSGALVEFKDHSTWHALSSMNLVPPSDLFSRLRSDAVIEIYDLNALQIWRNFNFMKFCSYTLEEIYSVEWFNRYRRPPEQHAQCIEYISRTLSDPTHDIFSLNIPSQMVEEICSRDRLVIKVDFTLLSKLKDRSGNPAAFLLLADVRLIGSAKEISDVHFLNQEI